MIRRFAILAPYFARQRRPLLGIVVTTLLLSASGVLYPWPMKLLIDHALGDGPLPFEIGRGALVVLAAVAVLALFAVSAALDVALSWFWMDCGQRMVYDLTISVFRRLLHIPAPLQRREVGDNLERLFGDTWCVYTVASDALISPLQNGLTLLGIILVAYQVDASLTLLSIIAAPALACSAYWFGPRLKRRALQGREARSRLASFVHQTLTSLPLVHAYGAQQRNQDRYNDLADGVVVVAQRRVVATKLFALFNGAASETGRALVLLVGGASLLRGNLSIGALVLFLSYVKTMQQSCERLLKTYATLRGTEASIERLQEVIEAPEHLESPSAAAAVAPVAARRAAIRLRNVSFEYAPGAATLVDIDMAIAPGEQIGVVGESGAGKSTLVSLIPRLIDPTVGAVEVEGVDLRHTDVRTARSNVAMLLQDAFLLPMSVAENIGLGKKGAGRDEIIRAAEAAGAHGFIQALPNGYDTVLGERGVTLSGGEQHRLAIARALLRNAPIVVLDEPTAALDPAAERKLLEGLQRLTAGRTSIIVSHRLTTLQGVDRVIVLDNGRIVEQGSPADLLSAEGYYYRLHRSQALPSAAGAVA